MPISRPGIAPLKQEPQILGVDVFAEQIEGRRNETNDAGVDEGGSYRRIGRQPDDENQGRDRKAATADAGQSYGEGDDKPDQIVHHSALFEKMWIRVRALLRAHFLVVGAEARE